MVCVPPSAVTSTTPLLPVSAMKTLPEPSTATPSGQLSPEPTVVWMPSALHLHHPVVAGVGDEDVAGAVHRHALGVTRPMAGTTIARSAPWTPELLAANVPSPLYSP